MKYIFIIVFLSQFFTASAFAQQYKYHTVKEGETVTTIAEKYNISLETLYTYNPDAKAGISINSKLVVPVREEKVQSNEVEFREHKVKRKENLFRLSQRYNVSIDDIRRYNPHLYSEELQRGETIRIPVIAQKPNPEEEPIVANPKKNPFGLTVKEHVVLPKEGKFGIAQKYNITIEELNKLNPGIDTLHPGMVLKIANGGMITPVKRKKIFKYYRVKPQETLFSLTNRLGISKDSLVVLNPALADGLKAGMVLKIPNLDAAEAYEEYAEEERLNLESRISDYGTKDIAVMLPFGLDKIITTDTTTNVAERIRRDRVLQISLDFYSGVLMAVDSAQALGLSTNVKVFDTKQSTYEVGNITTRNDFSGVDVVIGPLLQSTAEAAVGRLRSQGIPVVSPLTKKGGTSWENFVQARPTDEMLENAMISYISDNAERKNIVIIADPAKSRVKNKLLRALPDSRTVNPVDGSYISKSELSSALVEGRPNWIILESNNIAVISDVTSALNAALANHEIVLFTTSRNSSYESDNISNLHLTNLRFTYPSVDKEFSGIEKNSFISKYLEKYGIVPNIYAVRGFDVTYDILLRLASSEDLLTSFEEEGTTEYVENKFDYDKLPSGSYINTAIYILRYGEDMQLKAVR